MGGARDSGHHRPTPRPVFWSGAHLAFLVLASGLGLGFFGAALEIRDGADPDHRSLSGRLDRAGRFLAAQMLYLIICLTGIALLVLPGLYWAARFSLFPFVIAEGESSPVASLRRSAELTHGRTGKVGGLLALLLLANIAGAAVLGLGLLVTIPFSVLTMADVYRQLTVAEAR